MPRGLGLHAEHPAPARDSRLTAASSTPNPRLRLLVASTRERRPLLGDQVPVRGQRHPKARMATWYSWCSAENHTFLKGRGLFVRRDDARGCHPGRPARGPDLLPGQSRALVSQVRGRPARATAAGAEVMAVICPGPRSYLPPRTPPHPLTAAPASPPAPAPAPSTRQPAFSVSSRGEPEPGPAGAGLSEER